jgi:GT2 family glycosyltransferase
LAYGMIATFGAEQRLVSVYPWDVRRLVRGNYIDVMALVRREILQEVGGFNLDMQGIGWEDYELWLRLAAAGHTGVHVPTFIGAYRTHAAQRTLDVNHNVGAIFEEMHERFPTLPWPSGKIRLPSDFLSDPSVRTGTPADAQP